MKKSVANEEVVKCVGQEIDFDMPLQPSSALQQDKLSRKGESPRFLRRLNTLRGLSHEEDEQVLARGA